jgi:hypothetical protein
MKSILNLFGLASLIAVSSASAAITYSGIQNIPIPSTFAGVSITLGRVSANVYTTDTSATNTSGSSWDLNFFLGGAGIANAPTSQPVRESSANLSFVHNLPETTPVNGTSVVSTLFGGSGFPNQHIGAGTNQFTNATSGYLGFVLDADSSGPLFGWMKVTLDNSGAQGVIESWAFETAPNTPIAVGAVPEPGVTIFLLAGMTVAAVRRRR